MSNQTTEGESAHTRLTGFRLSSGEPRVYRIDENNHVIEHAFAGDKWFINDLTNISEAPIAVSGTALISFTAFKDLPRVYYTSVGNHLTELAWTGEKWVSNLLS